MSNLENLFQLRTKINIMRSLLAQQQASLTASKESLTASENVYYSVAGGGGLCVVCLRKHKDCKCTFRTPKK